MALPNQIDPTAPAGSTSPALGDDQIRALKQFVVDVLGLPVTTNIAAALAEFNASGARKLFLQDLAADPSVLMQLNFNGDRLKYKDSSAVRSVAHTGEILSASSSTPANVAASGSAGSASDVSKSDHVHKLGIITTEGDLVQGGTSGTPERLAISAGLLGRSSNKIAWRAATDARGDIRAAMQPCVTMIRTSDSTNDLLTLATWVVVKPDGTLLDTTGTTSQGLQEAMDYAAENGYDLRVYGSGRKGTAPSGVNAAIISCSAPIAVPVLEGVDWRIHATINFGGAGGAPALVFDSIMASNIQFTDQIVCASGYTAGVRFRPANELPSDPNGPVITSSVIRMPSVVVLGSVPCIQLQWDAGGISSNIFEFVEPNGGSTGIQVNSGSGSTLFDHNFIQVRDCHAQDTCINAGSATTNATNIYGNEWRVQCDPNTSGVGAEIYGLHEIWNISVTNLEGNPTTGITLNTSAKKNIINLLRNDATTKINDAATEPSNTIIAPRVFLRAHKNGTDQTGVVTATYTDVTFATEVVDTMSAFSSPTFTCPYPGTYFISSRVAWKTPTDQAFLAVRILKNGSAVVAEYDGASGGTGSQGPMVSACIECAAGDTIKIQARHDVGSNQDIDGGTDGTWLTIARL